MSEVTYVIEAEWKAPSGSVFTANEAFPAGWVQYFIGGGWRFILMVFENVQRKLERFCVGMDSREIVWSAYSL